MRLAAEQPRSRFGDEARLAADAALAEREQQLLDDARVAAKLEKELADEALARQVEAQDARALQERREAAEEARRGSIRDVSELEHCQQRALEHVSARAEELHRAALEPLRQRVLGLGYAEASLTKVLRYIREEAPVIIHVKAETLPLLVKDGVYRNLFETSVSGGSADTAARSRWEDELFGRHYSGARARDRVKYGCLNMTGDIRGVTLAHQYGELFMILKPDVLGRTTFTDKDSSGCTGDDVATAAFYAHALQRYSDNELGTVLWLAETKDGQIRGCASTKWFSQYKEAQIHGPVSVKKDILGLSVPGTSEAASADLRANVASFRELSSCNVIWQGDLAE